MMDRLITADLQQLGNLAMIAPCHELPDLVQAAYMRGYAAGMRATATATQRPTATSSLQAQAYQRAEREFVSIGQSA